MAGQTSIGMSPSPMAGRRTPSFLDHSAVRWARANLFNSWINAIVTLVLAYFVIDFGWRFFNWAIVNAIWVVQNGDSSVCRQAKETSACWAFITEKHRFILFGTYPFEEHWRPLLAIVIFLSLYGISAMRRFWKRTLALYWAGGLLAIGILMWGGIFGLPFVENERWGGLVLTLILATFGIALAFPLSIALALGRRSRMPAIQSLSVAYIELIRGVPLISVLFMASVMFPLFLPEGFSIDKLLRAQVAIILFAAAYLAEVVRGSLQALPKGQFEAADALGLSYAQKIRLIVMPQALRLVIPPLVNTFIGMFKDTSLVVIIGLFDLLNAVKTQMQEPAWRGFGIEAYISVSILYFGFCYAMSKYSQRLEAELSKSHRR